MKVETNKGFGTFDGGRLQEECRVKLTQDIVMIEDETIVAKLRDAWPEVKSIYLFGSFASGDQRPGSDLDLAVMGPRGGIMPAELFDVMQSAIDCNLDLIDLRSAPTVLQKEVIEKGRLLWESNHFDTEMFELFIWSSYQRLNEERAEIIASGLASGSFYRQ